MKYDVGECSKTRPFLFSVEYCHTRPPLYNTHHLILLIAKSDDHLINRYRKHKHSHSIYTQWYLYTKVSIRPLTFLQTIHPRTTPTQGVTHHTHLGQQQLGQLLQQQLLQQLGQHRHQRRRCRWGCRCPRWTGPADTQFIWTSALGKHGFVHISCISQVNQGTHEHIIMSHSLPHSNTTKGLDSPLFLPGPKFQVISLVRVHFNTSMCRHKHRVLRWHFA